MTTIIQMEPRAASPGWQHDGRGSAPTGGPRSPAAPGFRRQGSELRRVDSSRSIINDFAVGTPFTIQSDATPSRGGPMRARSPSGGPALQALASLKREVAAMLQQFQRVAHAVHDVSRVRQTAAALARSGGAYGRVNEDSAAGGAAGHHHDARLPLHNVAFSSCSAYLNCISDDALESWNERWRRVETSAKRWAASSVADLSSRTPDSAIAPDTVDAVVVLDMALCAAMKALDELCGDVCAKVCSAFKNPFHHEAPGDTAVPIPHHQSTVSTRRSAAESSAVAVAPDPTHAVAHRVAAPDAHASDVARSREPYATPTNQSPLPRRPPHILVDDSTTTFTQLRREPSQQQQRPTRRDPTIDAAGTPVVTPDLSPQLTPVGLGVGLQARPAGGVGSVGHPASPTTVPAQRNSIAPVGAHHRVMPSLDLAGIQRVESMTTLSPTAGGKRQHQQFLPPSLQDAAASNSSGPLDDGVPTPRAIVGADDGGLLGKRTSTRLQRLNSMGMGALGTPTTTTTTTAQLDAYDDSATQRSSVLGS